jgi:hypothetical protein
MFHLSMRVYAAVSAVIFTLVALAHLARLLEQGSIVLLGWNVPMWFSVIGLIVAGYLAFEGFHFAWPNAFHGRTGLPQA